jgi:hypothetical protein
LLGLEQLHWRKMWESAARGSDFYATSGRPCEWEKGGIDGCRVCPCDPRLYIQIVRVRLGRVSRDTQPMLHEFFLKAKPT